MVKVNVVNIESSSQASGASSGFGYLKNHQLNRMNTTSTNTKVVKHVGSSDATQSQGQIIKMNSCSSDGMISVEMAGIDAGEGQVSGGMSGIDDSSQSGG